ncbi:dihydrolipoamide acetyltransferase family protein [Natrialba swarupiae]|uniref:2-oxo acid dehydrogenase subunit E2 n=1 Tax=Natrialba swarupiae TaxID=2448032 RepID=A0A5D5APH0_9EURY|nr:2-oxo acid dehydrogenase subunit E2 [Natrialba swarupiae]TYT61652.1 2-oxo acid dehydrogenase subunit E2 [Natrialba swarupiae]
MVREFELPDVGEGVAEGELVSWLVEEGDAVSEDQPIAEVETDKALVDVPSPVDGTIRELRYEEGDVIPVGDVFVTFDVDGEEPVESTDDAADTAGDDPESAEHGAGSPDATGAEADEVATPQDRVFAPPRVRRLAREEGIDLTSIQGSGPGGRITAADVRSAVAGDSQASTGSGVTSADAPADSDAKTGSDVTAASDAETTADTRTGPETDSRATSPPPSSLESADRDRTLAAPATRRIAREKGIDLDSVPAVEEREGEAFVTSEAVENYAAAQKRAQDADRAAVEAGKPVGGAGTDAFAPGESERREPFQGVRKRIAEAMVESKYSAPHVTHHDEVDVTALVETRERLKPRAEERGINLTYMPFITKAVIAALKEYPEMNAVLDEENEEIVYRDYYNIGIAAATDNGLMVPVVENADRKGLLSLSSETNELAKKARERSISPSELRGSTFTITNVGGIGGEYATPILNYPESGILGVGEIKRKPRVVTDENGEESIEPRSVLTLSLSFDHRLIDGAVGARFTNTVIEHLENPELLLLE